MTFYFKYDIILNKRQGSDDVDSAFRLHEEDIRVKKSNHCYNTYELIDLKTRFILDEVDKSQLKGNNFIRVTIRKQEFIQELLKHLSMEIVLNVERAHFRHNTFIIPPDYFKSLGLHHITFMSTLVQNPDFKYFKQNATSEMINKMYNYHSLQKIAFKDKVYLVVNNKIICYQGAEIDPDSELYSSIMTKLQLLS